MNLTFWIKLENLDVRVGVRNNNVKLFAVREEVCCEDFHMVGGFAEQAELVGLLLYTLCRVRLERIVEGF